jgi:flavorubredoxin
MTKIYEIAPDVYRISTFISERNIQMNQFLVLDDEPLIWHTGQNYLFTDVKNAVASIINPSKIRWIGFSHFESDECGSLNNWLLAAPPANPFCSFVGANVNMTDFSSKPAKGMQDNEIITTGKYIFNFQSTPHLPHGWDTGLLFEETNSTLFCSDLFHRNGDSNPLTMSDIIGETRDTLLKLESGPFKDYLPYTTKTEQQLKKLAALKPKTLAIMHGASFSGDGAKCIEDLDTVMKEVLGVK